MKTYAQLSLFPTPETTPTPAPLPLWHTMPKQWTELEQLLHADKKKFSHAVAQRLKEYWSQASSHDKTPRSAFIAIFSALTYKSLDKAANALRRGVHPQAADDFEKALQVARLR